MSTHSQAPLNTSTQLASVVRVPPSAAASPSAAPSPRRTSQEDEGDPSEYDAEYKLPPVIVGDASELEEILSTSRKKPNNSSLSDGDLVGGLILENNDSGDVVERRRLIHSDIVQEELEGAKNNTMTQSSSSLRNQKRHHGTKRCTVTIPMWFGCAVLCTILVGVVGFTPFFATQSNNEIVVGAARESYNTAVGNTGVKIYYKFINELITLILAYSQANFKPFQMTSVNFSNPFWDREWQLYFIGAAVTVPTRYFYYMDLATGHFTGQYPTGPNRTEMMRIVGNVNDVNFTLFRRNTLPPLEFQPVGSASLLFPPAVAFNAFFAKSQAAALVAPSLDVQGGMMYGYARFITSPLTTPPYTIPVGALLELLPLHEMISASDTAVTNVARFSGESVVLDDTGALVSCSLPALAGNIFVPVGTPGAICTTIVYNNVTTSKCRHSLSTLRLVWPLFGAAHDAYFLRSNVTLPGAVNLNVAFQSMNFSYVTFQFEGQEYMVSASSPSLEAGSGWWAAAITPTAPVYGPYIANRKRIILVVALVCAGMALLVLVLTFILMRPLGVLMSDMIAALRLQTQSDRYAKTLSRASGHPHQTGSSSSVTMCDGWRLQVSELHDIGHAVVCLHKLLEEVATMLPPPVILMIRTSLAQRTTAHYLSSSTTSSEDAGTIGSGSLSSSDAHAHPSAFASIDSSRSSTQSRSNKTKHVHPHGSSSNNNQHGIHHDRQEDENVVQMLAWFEDYYRVKGSVLPPPLEYAAAAPKEVLQLDEDVIEVVATTLEDIHQVDAPINIGTLEVTQAITDKSSPADDVDVSPPDHQAGLVPLSNHAVAANSILMNPTVSLRPARRRGFFMAVSLVALKCRPSHFAEAIAPLLSLVWHHGGEIEMIERSFILATFGCYVEGGDSASRAVTCAIAIAEQRGRMKRSLSVSRNDWEHEEASFESAARCTIAIDCGWFETSTFSCVLPGGRLMRRQVVSSVARDVAVKMLPLGEVLNERLLITGDALRHVDPKTFLGRAPLIMDHLRFDVKSWSKVSRRGSVFIFSVPTLMTITSASELQQHTEPTSMPPA
ncbi:transmembrane protein, putative, partial [Bodo saltans]